jgi:hypothetical protein
MTSSSSASQQSEHSGERVRRTKVASRGSSAAANNLSEAAIQRAVITYIEAVVPRCLIYAVPNASRRTRGGRATNGVAGLKRGVFDLCFCGPGGFVAMIEVKTAKGELSDEQEEIQSQLIYLGTPHAVVRSISDVKAALMHWGVETRDADREVAK